jgi:hypothetical protein
MLVGRIPRFPVPNQVNPASGHSNDIVNSSKIHDGRLIDIAPPSCCCLGSQTTPPFHVLGDSAVMYPPSQTQLTPGHLVSAKPVKPGQRVRVNHRYLRDLCESPSSPLDLNCRRLLASILVSDYYLSDSPEPEFGINERPDIIRRLEQEEGVTFPQHRTKRGTPLSALLTDPGQSKCLICGNQKTSAQRALECVRSHLGYRPFHCGGSSQGCKKCRPGEQ